MNNELLVMNIQSVNYQDIVHKVIIYHSLKMQFHSQAKHPPDFFLSL
jgi:hypothetical protein